MTNGRVCDLLVLFVITCKRMLRTSIRNAHKDVWKFIFQFFLDFSRLFKASKSTAILLFVVETLLGLYVVLELSVLSFLIDSVIGARGIGVLTSDISKYVFQQVVLFVALLPLLIVHHQWRGLAATLGITIRRATLVTSLFTQALPIAPIFLFLVVLCAYLVEYAKPRPIHWLFSFVVVAFAAHKFYQVAQITVYEGLTTGQFVAMAGSLLVLTGFLALRPYLAPGDHIGSPLRS